MRPRVWVLGLCLIGTLSWAGEDGKKEAAEKKKAEPSASSSEIYTLQIRVIFAGTSGNFGTVPNELSDMQTLLTKAFHYPTYEIENTIRLSVFSDEEATAVVFPDHVLRIIPKGAIAGENALKIKAELYQLPTGDATQTKLYLGNLPQVIGIEEKEKKEGQHQPVFPVMSSALRVSDRQWEAFGGVPVRVNTQGRVSANQMSSSPLTNPAESGALGMKKFLILGIQLEAKSS